MLEPQSTALFILLMAAFCGLLAWVVFAKQTVFRVLAASLAFVPAMLFGVAAVNKYYNYYQSWGSVAADLGAQSGPSVPVVSSNLSGRQVTAILSRVTQQGTADRQGETVRFTVTGQVSHLTRAVYVYLPPQYFRPGYRNYRFPAIELITGNPGEPQDWINVAGITQTFLTLLQDGVAKPAVLIMPDANGGRQLSLQCLNIPRGPQDASFLVHDVPAYLSHELRLQPSGPAWGVAGYSEGGYCAANLALVYPGSFGYSGVLSGYFEPERVQLGNPVRRFDPFHNLGRLRRLNTPTQRIRDLPVNMQVPQFWIGAGSMARTDVLAARTFQRLLLARQPATPLRLAPGGWHNMATWRALIPPMLEWMTAGLSHAASLGLPAGLSHQASLSPPLVAPAASGRRAAVRHLPGATTSPEPGLLPFSPAQPSPTLPSRLSSSRAVPSQQPAS